MWIHWSQVMNNLKAKAELRKNSMHLISIHKAKRMENIYKSQFSLIHQEQFISSVAQSCLTLCHPMESSTPGFPVHRSWSLLKLMSIALVTPSNHLILCHPLLLPSIFPRIRVCAKESALHISWPKYWSFSFSIGPSNEYLGLISFRIDWSDLLEIQGTLKSLLQHHSSKASIQLSLQSNSHIHTWLLENHSFD